jgi:hypothetical protein
MSYLWHCVAFLTDRTISPSLPPSLEPDKPRHNTDSATQMKLVRRACVPFARCVPGRSVLAFTLSLDPYWHERLDVRPRSHEARGSRLAWDRHSPPSVFSHRAQAQGNEKERPIPCWLQRADRYAINKISGSSSSRSPLFSTRPREELLSLNQITTEPPTFGRPTQAPAVVTPPAP